MGEEVSVGQAGGVSGTGAVGRAGRGCWWDRSCLWGGQEGSVGQAEAVSGAGRGCRWSRQGVAVGQELSVGQEVAVGQDDAGQEAGAAARAGGRQRPRLLLADFQKQKKSSQAANCSWVLK